MAPKKYVRDTFLAERYSVTRQCVWRWVQRGILPEPERITPGCTRFDMDAVEALERQRATTKNVEAATG